jgi:hypothetical protein
MAAITPAAARLFSSWDANQQAAARESNATPPILAMINAAGASSTEPNNSQANIGGETINPKPVTISIAAIAMKSFLMIGSPISTTR